MEPTPTHRTFEQTTWMDLMCSELSGVKTLDSTRPEFVFVGTEGHYVAPLRWVHSSGTGKCSHGGVFDQTRNTEPMGGINKDGPTAEHGHAHHAAARLATAATIELLDDIRGAAGNTDFLRYADCSLLVCLASDQSPSTRP